MRSARGKRMLIVADTTATAAPPCAVGMRALSSFGANVGFSRPQPLRVRLRVPEIVALAAQSNPRSYHGGQRIASVEGVARGRAARHRVIVTDHHLPGAELPRAAPIVNPTNPGCAFPSKSLRGSA